MKTSTMRLLSPTSICSQCRHRLSSPPFPSRLLSTSTRVLADQPADTPPHSPPKPKPSSLLTLSRNFAKARTDQHDRNVSNPTITTPSSTAPITNLFADQVSSSSDLSPSTPPPPPRLPDPHHLHIYAHTHNTHITLTTPQRQPIISVSTGNLNFRKAQRGTYDAAYQLGKYVMERIMQQGLLKEILTLEVVLRDFGPGREALTKVLLGSEGRLLRGRVVRVADATRVKFGGTRSEKRRRLG